MQVGKGQIIGAWSFPALEDAFVRELADVARDTGSVVWVLAPTNLLALHLRREAARAAGGLMGVEFLTLTEAARRMAQVRLIADGKCPLPEGAAELVIERLLEDVGADSYLAAFREFRNGPAALERALRLFANCLWRPDALRQAARAAHLSDPTAPSRLRALADLWEGFTAWKDGAGCFDGDDLLLEAGREDREPAARPDVCLIYGFYDLNPAQRRLVRRIVDGAASVTAYVLWTEDGGEPARGFEYARPTVRWLQEALGAESVTCLPHQEDGTDLGRLTQGCFTQRDRPNDDDALAELGAEGWDGTVRVVSCPGEEPEAQEVVREILRAARERADGEPATAGVLLRSAEESAALLAESLDRTGIRYSVREGLPLGHALAGRIAVKLLELAAGDAERTAVVDFLSLARIDWPEGLSATVVDRLSRQAGITRGRRAWLACLRSHSARLVRSAEKAEDEHEARACVRDAELCRTVAGFLETFFAETKAGGASSWAEATERLQEQIGRYAPLGEEGTAPVLEAVGNLAALDVSGLPPDDRRLSRVLTRLLGSTSLHRERFRHVGTCVSSIMAVRGATFDVVVVPGLIEKGFPRHTSAASPLAEQDREALNAVADRIGAGALPEQQDRPAEERYLFRLALASARRAIVLTYARIEQHAGRPKIASRFLVEACSALAGLAVTASDLDAGLPASLVRRVPLGERRWSPDELELALDTREYDAAVFEGGSGEPPRTDYLARVSPWFARAVEMERRRWGRAEFGPYDGKIRAPDLLQALREKHARFGRPMSPTRLETFAGCPFQYFMTYLLGVEEVEQPPEEFELTPMERGSLMHTVLARLGGEKLKGGTLGQWSEGELEGLIARAGELLDEEGRTHAANRPATWAAERELMLEQILRMLQHERDGHGQATPDLFEFVFGDDERTAYSISLDGDNEIAFHGRIDRVDRLPDGAIDVVDYKTGSASPYKAGSLRGGRQLQLPVYVLATAASLGARAASGRYLFVGEPADKAQPDLDELRERMGDFRRIVGTIVGQIEAGNFFPLPPDDRSFCDRWCPYACACGAAREFLAEMKSGDPDLARLHELRAIE